MGTNLIIWGTAYLNHIESLDVSNEEFHQWLASLPSNPRSFWAVMFLPRSSWNNLWVKPYTILHPSQRVPLKQQHPPQLPRTLNNRIVSEDSDEPQAETAWDGARLTALNHAAQGAGDAAQGPRDAAQGPSRAHNEGRCRPCIFFSIGGCRANGCRYCHEFHPKVVPERRLLRRVRKITRDMIKGRWVKWLCRKWGILGILQNDHLNWGHDEKPLDFKILGSLFLQTNPHVWFL